MSLHVRDNRCHSLCIPGKPETGTCRNLIAYFCVDLLFFCFYASLRVMRLFLLCVCSPVLRVAIGLGRPLLSRIIAFEDMQHEFLIHCMFLLSYRESEYVVTEGKSLPPPGILHTSYGASNRRGI